MALTSTVLFDTPQREIASLITARAFAAFTLRIVTGFATPGGLAAIAAPIKATPKKLVTLVVGAATYKGFEAIDELLAAGVPPDRLHIHLGHSSETGGKRNPFARYHPMLHSKVYYMEFPDGNACAFIGSHNMTTFALGGLNGEAAVLLEGPKDSAEFEKVRQHIDGAHAQALVYSPDMKDAYAWWMREFLDGMKTEIGVPNEWTSVRTILLFASTTAADRPKTGDRIYFEIPAGIEQIESLKTEAHLFLFDTLPATPRDALNVAGSAVARYRCITLGADNEQGNKEVGADWRIDGSSAPVLVSVPSATYRPSPPAGMQQVRAKVQEASVAPFDYSFERERKEWSPEFAIDGVLLLPERHGEPSESKEARAGHDSLKSWKLVKKLVPRQGSPREKDEAALKRAAPESGSFLLVSLRRRSLSR